MKYISQMYRTGLLSFFLFAGFGLAHTAFSDGGGPNVCLQPADDDPDDPKPSSSHVWAGWPDCEWVLAVELVPASNQGYPAADIHPDICLNAQSAYTTTKFDVKINHNADTATATLSVRNGSNLVSLDKNSVSDGDTVTVNGNSVGNYTIEITHDDDSNYTNVASGTVFEFKFVPNVKQKPRTNETQGLGTTSSPSSSITSTTETGRVATLESGGFDASGSDNSEHYSRIGVEYEYGVETSPQYTGPSLDVKAKANFSISFDLSGSIIESDSADGSNTSISLGYGLVSASFGGSGSRNVAGVAFAWSYECSDNGPSGDFARLYEKGSDDFNVGFFSNQETESYTETRSGTFADNERTFSADDNASLPTFEITVAAGSITTGRFQVYRYDVSGFSDDVLGGTSVDESTIEIDDITEGDIAEFDGIFEIQ